MQLQRALGEARRSTARAVREARAQWDLEAAARLSAASEQAKLEVTAEVGRMDQAIAAERAAAAEAKESGRRCMEEAEGLRRELESVSPPPPSLHMASLPPLSPPDAPLLLLSPLLSTTMASLPSLSPPPQPQPQPLPIQSFRSSLLLLIPL